MTVANQILFQDAEKLYYAEQYLKAIFNYSKILEHDPNNRKARLLTILTEMVMNKEKGGEALYDYYLFIRDQVPNPEDIVEDILNTIDNQSLEFNKILENEAIKSQIIYSDGLTYSEFKDLIVPEKGFKRAFEDTIFSTKIIITNKKDLKDLLNNLINYGFDGIAMSYLESAMISFPNDKTLNFIKKKITNKQ